METIRKLIFKELEREQDCDSFGTLEIAAINFIGYKNKQDIGKLVLSLETLNIDLYELKKRIETILLENSIKYKTILVEL